MLFKRILTALILAAVVITAIFTLPTLLFYLFIGIIVLIAAWEWTGLSEIDTVLGKLVFLLCLIIPMLGITLWTQILEIIANKMVWPELKKQSGIIDWFVMGPVIFWILIMFLIRKSPDELLKFEIKKRYKVFIGWFVLLAAWMFVVKLRAFYGADAIMYFLGLIWVADIAAYFSGKLFGKDQLAPKISPGKTVQGMYGALISAMICGLLLALFYDYPMMVAADFGLLSVLTVLMSIYGDLFFSLVKRKNDVKDSGSILPGHGGILDRIDSVIAAAPFYFAGVHFIIPGLFGQSLAL